MKTRRVASRVYTPSCEGVNLMSKRLWGLLVICVFGVVLPLSAAKTQPRGISPPNRIPDVIEPTQSSGGDPVTTAAIPREVRRAVVADAAKRFGVAESAVVLARAVQITWSDGSLG